VSVIYIYIYIYICRHVFLRVSVLRMIGSIIISCIVRFNAFLIDDFPDPLENAQSPILIHQRNTVRMSFMRDRMDDH